MLNEIRERFLSWFKYPPAVSAIALICVAVYTVQAVSSHIILRVGDSGVSAAEVLNVTFGLYWPIASQGAFWQPVTYTFMHGSIFHLFLNMFSLLFFGAAVEDLLGTKRFCILFLCASVIGGIGWMICDSYEPSLWNWVQTLPSETCRRLAQRWGEAQIAGRTHNICVGASAGVFGLIGAFAALCPRQRLVLLIFYIIPLKMQTRYVAILLMFVTFGELVIGNGRVAYAAHLFGGLAGYIYARLLKGNRFQTLT